MRFYLGTHKPHWLALVDFPLMVSHRTLAQRRTLPRARAPWALDSGGFTEIATYGHWTIPPQAYVEAVARYAAEIGQLDWAAPQDWMCEPFMVERTGLSVAEHQHRTIANYLTLRVLAPAMPFVPVLQGYRLADYHRHADAYLEAGVDLARERVVGLGSVCRRQATGEIAHLVATLADRGIRLHGFGVKTSGLGRYAHDLRSADSMAWSLDARRARPLPGCPHRSCANCIAYATRWRAAMLAGLPTHQQLRIPLGVPA